MALRFRPGALADLRVAAGLSRDRLAAMSGVSRVSIFMAETGRTLPRPETVKSLADALGISTTDLYDEVPSEDVA